MNHNGYIYPLLPLCRCWIDPHLSPPDTTHTLSLLVFAQGEDIMCRHSEGREYKMPSDIDYMPSMQPASSSFSLSSLPFPRFVRSLDGWKHSHG